MRLVLDLDVMFLVKSPGSQVPERGVEGIRGHESPIELQLVKAGQPVELDANQQLKYVAKLEGEYDSDPAAAVEGDDSVWIWDATAELYRTTVSYITAALNTAFQVDGNAANDVASLDLHIGVGIRDAGDDNWRCNSNPVDLTLRNNVLRDDDGTPIALPDAEAWLFRYGMLNPGYWTALTGGASQSVLDARVTAGGAVPTGHVVQTCIGGVLRTWQLQASTAAENEAGGLVRPDDYAASTNERVWVKIA
jgi:hypothetical protein